MKSLSLCVCVSMPFCVVWVKNGTKLDENQFATLTKDYWSDYRLQYYKKDDGLLKRLQAYEMVFLWLFKVMEWKDMIFGQKWLF